MSGIEFSKSLEPAHLVDWLDGYLKENSKVGLRETQRENLLGEEINGAAFVLLTEDDLKDLGFTMGQRKIILESIKQLQTANKPAENGKEKQTPTVCSAGLVMSAGANSDTFGMAAWAPGDKLWKEKSTLKVRFMQDTPVDWKIDGKSVSRSVILQLANIWNDKEVSIPKFVETDNLEDSDIRVKFYTVDEVNGAKMYGQTWSEVGTDATKRKGEATMSLDLSHEDNNYKKHVIVHEFGHALGLGHEHQRSIFWEIAGRYIQVSKMFESIKRLNPRVNLSYDQFKVQWGVDKTPGSGTESYDSLSVMHYWFDVGWLEDQYSQYKKLETIEKDPALSDVAKKVLMGIHKKPGDLPTEPSGDDVCFLRDQYTPVKKGHLPAPPKTTSSQKRGSSSTSSTGQDGELPIPSQKFYIDDSDWITVCGYLQALETMQIKLLGGELGLNTHNLEKMKDLPADMVRAWLRRDYKVTERCGDRLTWNALVKKLRKIGVEGVANDILRKECRQT